MAHETNQCQCLGSWHTKQTTALVRGTRNKSMPWFVAHETNQCLGSWHTKQTLNKPWFVAQETNQAFETNQYLGSWHKKQTLNK